MTFQFHRPNARRLGLSGKCRGDRHGIGQAICRNPVEMSRNLVSESHVRALDDERSQVAITSKYGLDVYIKAPSSPCENSVLSTAQSLPIEIDLSFIF